MRLRPCLAVTIIASLAGSGPAAAQDPFVYRECLAQCRQFKDRACCHETCSYTACIADKTKASVGYGTARDGVRLDQTDPGAWSAAMAACYPWISILKECSAGTPGTPGSGVAAVKPSPTPSPAAPAGKVVLRRVGQPKPTATDANWVTVQSGNIVNKGYGYQGTYTWGEPPAEIPEGGHTIDLKAVAQCENGQRMATGLAIDGEVDLVGPTDPKPKSRLEFPANCESSPGASISARAGGAVRIVPRKGYARGAQVKLRVGVFWGAEVVYLYEAVGP